MGDTCDVCGLKGFVGVVVFSQLDVNTRVLFFFFPGIQMYFFY